MSYTTVGVTGHIDHGKTSLVAALTSVDTDTDPEEKRRGITIDLGFASMEDGVRRFAFIDAPGHQKYVGNLLSGVSGIDLGLLVVACDQGIQAQTFEHASILKILGVRRLIAIISRVDLAGEAMCLDLEDELKMLLDDLGYSEMPILSTSIATGVGLAELKTELSRQADLVQRGAASRHFRMPIDRAFNMPGRGCVIAGTIWSGSIELGDSLVIAHSNRRVRVRQIEVHGQQVERSTRGFRTALNVTPLSLDEVHRGDELVDPDVFHLGATLLVEIDVLSGSPTLRCPATLQLHTATTSCSARVTGIRKLVPGQTQVAVIETDKAIVATFDQKCLLRLPYPVGTYAGGRILAVMEDGRTKKRNLLELGRRLVSCDVVERLAAWADFAGEIEPNDRLAHQLGIESDATTLDSIIAEAVGKGSIATIPRTASVGTIKFASKERIAGVKKYATRLLGEPLQKTQSSWHNEESVIRQLNSHGSIELCQWVINELVDSGQVVRLKGMLAHSTAQDGFSKKTRVRMDQFLKLYHDNRAPPTLKEAAEHMNMPQESLASLARFAIQAGVLTEVGNGFLFASDVFERFCEELSELFQESAERSAADIKNRWQVTRKHAIPLLEYCDRIQLTVRVRDVRSAGKKLSSLHASTARTQTGISQA